MLRVLLKSVRPNGAGLLCILGIGIELVEHTEVIEGVSG
jgi:hypothetical protein